MKKLTTVDAYIDQFDAEQQEVLQQALVNDTSLYQAYEALTKGKQREYNTYIMEAKQEKTKHARLQKIIPLIQQGKGLHDKYRK